MEYTYPSVPKMLKIAVSTSHMVVGNFLIIYSRIDPINITIYYLKDSHNYMNLGMKIDPSDFMSMMYNHVDKFDFNYPRMLESLQRWGEKTKLSVP